MQEQGRDEASAPGILELSIPKSCSEIESAGTAEHMFAWQTRTPRAGDWLRPHHERGIHIKCAKTKCTGATSL